MITRNKSKYILVCVSTIMLIMTSGCRESKFQKIVDETDKENELVQDNKPVAVDIVDEETAPEDVQLSDEQMDKLKEIEKSTPDDAALENQLEIREEVDINVPLERTVYKDKEEFSQFISHYFYMYHTKQIESLEFYQKVSKHFHEDFIELLPSTEENRINTFKVLQETFTTYLPSPIVDYKITNTKTDVRTLETSFYRMYELKNGQKIYYLTILKPVNNNWLLVDDSPTPPYAISGAIKEQFTDIEEDNQDDD